MIYKNDNGTLRGVANNIPLMMYSSKTAYDNAKTAGTVPNNVLVSINESDTTTQDIEDRVTALEEQVALSGTTVIIANNKVLGSTSSDSYTYTPSVNGIFKAYGLKAGAGNSVQIQKGTGTTWEAVAANLCPGAKWDDYPVPVPQFVSDNGGTVTDLALHSWYIQGFAEKGVTYRLLTNDTEHKFTLMCWSFFATK